jgi:hypothetical protein
VGPRIVHQAGIDSDGGMKAVAILPQDAHSLLDSACFAARLRHGTQSRPAASGVDAGDQGRAGGWIRTGIDDRGGQSGCGFSEQCWERWWPPKSIPNCGSLVPCLAESLAGFWAAGRGKGMRTISRASKSACAGSKRRCSILNSVRSRRYHSRYHSRIRAGHRYPSERIVRSPRRWSTRPRPLTSLPPILSRRSLRQSLRSRQRYRRLPRRSAKKQRHPPGSGCCVAT